MNNLLTKSPSRKVSGKHFLDSFLPGAFELSDGSAVGCNRLCSWRSLLAIMAVAVLVSSCGNIARQRAAAAAKEQLQDNIEDIIKGVAEYEDGWRYDLDIQPGAANFAEYLPLLEGKRVCLLSNQTGIIERGSYSGRQDSRSGIAGTGRYVHIVDTLVAQGIDIVCLMSPEHGFRGTADAGEKVNSAVDEQTGIEVRSLYGSKIPDEELMAGFDVLVFDLQDVGVRFYTYYVTMKNMMAKCAKYNIPFILLDRPNPLSFYTDGPLLDVQFKSGVGGLPIPVVYGLTIGELAYMANEKGWLEWGNKREDGSLIEHSDLKCSLTVVRCLNFKHSKHYRLPVRPSPNLPNMRSVYLYPSICYFEATPVSLGRGTDAPFQLYGSPEMKGSLCSLQDGVNGGKIYSFSFVPQSVPGAKNPPQLGNECYGVDLRTVPSVIAINQKQIDLSYLIDAYNGSGRPGDKFFNRMLENEIGQAYVRQMIKEGADAAAIRAVWQKDVEHFISESAPYHLYE